MIDASIMEEYRRLRDGLTYPARDSLRFARQWIEIQELEQTYDISIKVEDDDLPIRGNLICTGDDKLDRKFEDEVIGRVHIGDVWAWAAVTVTVNHAGCEAYDHLGGCCYEDELQFKRGGYYYDMIHQCLDQIKAELLSNQEGEH